MIRILIVDSHHLVVECLTQIIESATDMAVMGEAADGEAALTLLQSQPFDVVLMEIALPGKSGLHWLKTIKKEYPDLPVLILTMYSEQHYAARCIRTGAAGYLTKNHCSTNLLTAIRRAASGHTYITSAVSTEIVAAMNRRSKAEAETILASLSNREWEVLRFLANGYTICEIARHLGLSPKTISVYRSRLLEKTGCQNTIDLTRYAIQQGVSEHGSD